MNHFILEIKIRTYLYQFLYNNYYILYFIYSLLQNVSPNSSNGTSHRIPPERPPKPTNGVYPQIGSGGKDIEESDDRDYEILNPSARIRPTRPAPQPPTSIVTGSTSIYGTLPGSSDLDGVPFILNSRLSVHSDSSTVSYFYKSLYFHVHYVFFTINRLQNKLPVIKIWTQENLDKEVRLKYIIY